MNSLQAVGPARHTPVSKQVLPWLLGALLTAGCGGGKGDVTGSVTHQGKKLSGGTVVFLTETNKVFTGQISADGGYMVHGVPAGPVKIGVQVPNQTMFIDRDRGGHDSDKSPPPPSFPAVPANAGDPNASGLTFSISAGKQGYDIVVP